MICPSRALLGVLLGFFLLGAAGGTGTAPQHESGDPARRQAAALLDRGNGAEALAILDSLLVADLTDLTAGYLAARAEEQTGREDRARCRYLELEGLARGREEAILAQSRRRAIERARADQQLSLGPAWMTSPESVSPVAGGIVLLPLDNLGEESDAPFFGLTWTYLLQEALRGSGLCPVSIPSMLLVGDLLTRGQAIRAHADLSRRPVNTVGGLRARLSVLTGADGSAYLESRDGDWDDELRRALRRFQQDHGLPPSGEADLSTQSALEQLVEGWLAQPPLPLAPNLLPRAMDLLGASLVLRGTYRIEGDDAWVQVTLLDAQGQGLLAEPIVLHFPRRQTTASAFAAADQLARVAGGELSPSARVAPSLSPLGLDRATAALLLLDRGIGRLAEQRWVSIPEESLSWDLLRDARAFTAMSADTRNRTERGLVDRWVGQVRLDPALGFDLLMDQLGGVSGVGGSEPGPFQVLGDQGTLRIRGVAQ